MFGWIIFKYLLTAVPERLIKFPPIDIICITGYILQKALLKIQALFQMTHNDVGKMIVTYIRSHAERQIMKIFSPVRSDLVFTTAMMVIRFPRVPNMMIGIPIAKAVTRTKSEYRFSSSLSVPSDEFIEAIEEDAEGFTLSITIHKTPHEENR